MIRQTAVVLPLAFLSVDIVPLLMAYFIAADFLINKASSCLVFTFSRLAPYMETAIKLNS